MVDKAGTDIETLNIAGTELTIGGIIGVAETTDAFRQQQGRELFR